MPPRYLLLLWTLSLSLAAGWSQEADCKYSWYVPPDDRIYILQSPNYPSNYRPGSHCYWHLYTDPGYTIYLNCNSVNLERGPTKERYHRRQRSPEMVSDYETNLAESGEEPSLRTARNMMPPTELDFLKPYSIGWRRRWERYRVGSLLDRASGHFQTKIVGGTETGINEFPSMAALIDVRNRRAYCGATIISQRYVVTAAHCIVERSLAETVVLVGDHNLITGSETSATRLYRAKRFVVHPGYDGLKNDIGLVEVEQPMAFSSRVGPVCLPFNRPNVPEVGEQLTVLGWGLTSFGGTASEVLMKAAQRVVPFEWCQQSYSTNDTSPDLQVCTYEPGKDSCQMDSGGPLLSANAEAARYFLASIVSYGKGCAGDEPSISTRVYNYLDWIITATGGQEDFCIK